MKQKIRKKEVSKVFITAIILFIIFFVGILVSRDVAASSEDNGKKIYTSVQLQEGDSLWSIAGKYHSENISIDEYINELRRINNIENDGALKAGNYITIYTF